MLISFCQPVRPKVASPILVVPTSNIKDLECLLSFFYLHILNPHQYPHRSKLSDREIIVSTFKQKKVILYFSFSL
jgi:hypothetical protein